MFKDSLNQAIEKTISRTELLSKSEICTIRQVLAIKAIVNIDIPNCKSATYHADVEPTDGKILV
jgi:hypothetical protein